MAPALADPVSLTCVIDNQIDWRADDKEWKEHVHQVVPPIPGRRITVDNDAGLNFNILQVRVVHSSSSM